MGIRNKLYKFRLQASKVGYATGYSSANDESLPASERLPTELLQAIFLLTISTPNTVHSDDACRVSETISKVCKRWRKVSLSLPALWCTLPPMRLRHQACDATHISLLKEYLQRSADLTLAITVEGNSTEFFRTATSNAPPDTVTHPVISALLQHAARWGSVTTKTCAPFLRTLLYHPDHHFTQLRYLNTTILSGRKDSPPEFINISNLAPVLQEVEIHGHANQVVLLLPWTQLQQYKEATSNRGFLRNVLTHSLHLHTLDVSRSPRHPIPIPGPILLPHLRSLTWTMAYDPHHHTIDVVLNQLVLPSLEEARFRVSNSAQEDSERGDFVEHLTHLVVRSAASRKAGRALPLRRLAFRTSHPLPPNSFQQIITLLPFLEELDMDVPLAEVHGALYPPNPSSGLQSQLPSPLPNLTKLHLHLPTLLQSDLELQQIADIASRGRKAGDKVQPLEDFRLWIAGNSAMCSTQRFALEGWLKPSDSLNFKGDQPQDILVRLKTKLLEHLPELGDYCASTWAVPAHSNVPRPPRSRLSDRLTRGRSLHRIFKQIEQLKVEHARHIAVSIFCFPIIIPSSDHSSLSRYPSSTLSFA